MDSRFGSEYNSANGLQAITEMHSNVPHCNYLYLDCYIDVSATANTAIRRVTGSNSEANLAAAIAKARTLDMKTVLRIRAGGATFRPSNPTLFMQNYAAAVVGWAAWAQTQGIELFGIGNELEHLETYTPEFNAVITAARAVYTGQIFYTTNWPNSAAKLQMKIAAAWMDNLDLIMISAYNELELPSTYAAGGAFETANPTVAQLVAAHHSYCTWGGDPLHSYKGTDIANSFKQLALAHNKHVVFNCGIASYHASPSAPWTGAGTPPDLEIQDRVYQAFFAVYGSEYWVDGWMLDGGWLTTPLANKNPNNGEFTIQGKPSMATVENGFAALSPAPPPPPAQYVLNVETVLGGTTTPTGIQALEAGTVVSIQATAAQGYKFGGWQVTVGTLPVVTYPDTENPLILTMTAAETDVMPLFNLVPVPPTCPMGYHWDATANACVQDTAKTMAARTIGPLGVPAAFLHQLWRLRERFIRPEVHRKLHPLV